MLKNIDKCVVIAPHPDDEIIGAGGTLIQASKKKCKVEIIYLTSGKKNEKKIRENELRKVCKDQNFTFYIIGGEANKKLLGLSKISKIPIFVGGTAPTYSVEETLKNFPINYVVRGEAENVFLEIADSIDQKKDITKKKGISKIPFLLFNQCD